MPTRRTRLLAPVLLTTAGLAFAGCGGGGGGDEDAYVQTYEASCKKIQTVQTDLQKELTAKVADAGSDQAKVLAIVKETSSEAFGTFAAEFKKLADADAPDKWSDFQDKIKKASEPVISKLEEGQKKFESAKTAQELSSVGNSLGSLDIDDVKTPKDLEEKVPSCRFGSSASS